MSFRSKLEAMVDSLLPDEWEYEPFRIPYTIHRKYTPDFVLTTDDKQYIMEVKGFFRAGDTQKYKAIRDSLEEHQELIFFLSSPFKKISKTGQLTISKWLEKEGIKWFVDPYDLQEYIDGHI